MTFVFEANGLLCWDTRLHHKMATHSWETHLCPPSRSPVSCLRQAVISLLLSDMMSQAVMPISTMIYGASLNCKSGGLDKLLDMKWTFSLVAAGPVVLGLGLLPSHSWQAGGKDLHLQLQSFIQLPGVVEECKNHQSLLTLPQRQREVWGGWVRWSLVGKVLSPRQGSSGNHSFLQAMGRFQSLPTGCVWHEGEARSQVPNLRMQISSLKMDSDEVKINEVKRNRMSAQVSHGIRLSLGTCVLTELAPLGNIKGPESYLYIDLFINSLCVWIIHQLHTILHFKCIAKHILDRDWPLLWLTSRFIVQGSSRYIDLNQSLKVQLKLILY